MRVDVLRGKLPGDVLLLIAAHAAATILQAWMRGRLVRCRGGAAQQRKRLDREELAMRFIASFAFGSVPMTLDGQ